MHNVYVEVANKYKGWTDVRTDARTNGSTEAQMDVRTDGQRHGWTDGEMHVRIDCAGDHILCCYKLGLCTFEVGFLH